MAPGKDQAIQRGIRSKYAIKEGFRYLLASVAYPAAALGKGDPHRNTLVPLLSFAQIDLETEYHFVQRTPGVVGLLCAGGEPSEVDESVIEEIRKRGTNGIVEVPQGTFSSGESVSVVSGPLRGISAIFERYMSGSQRAALLLDLIGGASVRTILPCALIAPLNKPAPVAVASRRALT